MLNHKLNVIVKHISDPNYVALLFDFDTLSTYVHELIKLNISYLFIWLSKYSFNVCNITKNK